MPGGFWEKRARLAAARFVLRTVLPSLVVGPRSTAGRKGHQGCFVPSGGAGFPQLL